MARHLRLALICLAAAAVLAAAACDGDDGSSGTGAGSAATTAAATEAETTETDPAAAQEVLKDTGSRPVIPKPTGEPPRRLLEEEIVKGKGPAARPGDVLLVHYVGLNFSNGGEFSASWDAGGPLRVELGSGQVIEGWDRGLVGIRQGGRRKLTVPPELGYGSQGYPPDGIPPNETLVFVVDAVSVKRGR